MKYKVLEDGLNLNGIIYEKNAIIDLDFRVANLKSVQGKIEKVLDQTKPVDSSALGGVVPGVPLTPEQKVKLAEENAKETAEAHRLAADQRARDVAEGREKPAVAAVADALKEKLENNEFQKKDVSLPDDTLPADVDPNNLP